MNKIKWFAVVVLFGAAIIGFQYYASFPMGVRLAGLVGLVGVALGIGCTTAQGRDALEFIRNARAEARKVVWPTRQETIQSTVAVVIMVLGASLFLWVLDSLLLYIMSWVTA